jgi:hypothetical protein
MIRQRLLWKVIGRRLVERLLRAGWIEPVRANGNGIFYDEYAVHRALKRLGREGYLINGDVRNGFRFETTKVRKLPLEDLFANLSLEDL